MASKTDLDELEKEQEPQVPNPSTCSDHKVVGLIDLSATFFLVVSADCGIYMNGMRVFRSLRDGNHLTIREDLQLVEPFTQVLSIPGNPEDNKPMASVLSNKYIIQSFVMFLLGQLNRELRLFKSAVPFVDTVWNYSFLEDYFRFGLDCCIECSFCNKSSVLRESSMSISVPRKMLSLTVLFVPPGGHFKPIKYRFNLPVEACAWVLTSVVTKEAGFLAYGRKLKVFTVNVRGVVQHVGNEEAIANINPLPTAIIVAETDDIPSFEEGEFQEHQGDVAVTARNDEPITLEECLTVFRQPWFSKDEKRSCARSPKHMRVPVGCLCRKSILNPPELLTIQLKHQTSVLVPIAKTDRFVKFPLMGLDMTEHSLGASQLNRSPLYDLYAVVVHNGNAHGGHYTAYIKTSMRQSWQSFSDSSVAPIEDADVSTKDASVLFYKRRP